MRVKRILSPLGAIILALPLFQGVCPTDANHPDPLVITTATIPGGATGAAYSQQFAATGGTPPYTWSLAAGSTTPGTVALSAGGLLSGTPNLAGDFSITVQVHDDGSGSASKQYPLVIAAGLSSNVPNTLPDAHQFSDYTFTLTATGGTAPYSWTIVGALPAGLSLSTAGVISGAPTTNGAFTFSVKCVDANGANFEQPVMFNIAIPAVSITSGPVPDGETNVAYSTAITAIGGAPPYSWSVSSGALPAGLTLTSGGVIAGTPSGSGASSFTLRVADGASNIQNAAFTLTVKPAVSIATTTLSGGQKGTAYNVLLGASGGVAPYDWTLVSGALPAGILLAGNGTLGGTPTATGTATFTLKLTDHLGGFASQNYSLVIAGPQVTITTASLPDGEVGAPYNKTMAANGTPPYTWTIGAGALPAGVTLSSAGVISGTPTVNGPVNVAIHVSDGTGSQYEKLYFFQVPLGVSISTTSLPAGQLNSSYSQNLTATHGSTPYTWSIVGGALPVGTTLSAGGTISGVATVIGTASFTVKALDALGASDTRPLTIDINTLPLTITTATLPDCDLESIYNQQLVATGGSQPYTWSLQSGTLFTGWTLSAAGVVHGACGSSGSQTFTVKVTDASSNTQTRTYTITWHPDPTIVTASLPNGQVGAAYNQSILTSGGIAPIAWHVGTGALPTGITLDGATGVLSGTPTVAAAYTFLIVIADSGGFVDSKTYHVTIAP